MRCTIVVKCTYAASSPLSFPTHALRGIVVVSVPVLPDNSQVAVRLLLAELKLILVQVEEKLLARPLTEVARAPGAAAMAKIARRTEDRRVFIVRML
jgi:hypothetical protein